MTHPKRRFKKRYVLGKGHPNIGFVNVSLLISRNYEVNLVYPEEFKGIEILDRPTYRLVLERVR